MYRLSAAGLIGATMTNSRRTSDLLADGTGHYSLGSKFRDFQRIFPYFPQKMFKYHSMNFRDQILHFPFCGRYILKSLLEKRINFLGFCRSWAFIFFSWEVDKIKFRIWLKSQIFKTNFWKSWWILFILFYYFSPDKKPFPRLSDIFPTFPPGRTWVFWHMSPKGSEE